MKIAYVTSYMGSEFMVKFCQSKKFALSGSFKSQGMARAMLAAGHEVIIYSPAVSTCDVVVPSFSEVEVFPEGKLQVKYPKIISKHRCDPINQIRASRLLMKEHKVEHFDIVVYYNITIGAAILCKGMKDCARVLEYEDNIFNKALVGDKNNFEWFKRKLYNRIISNTDGVMAVCNGLMLPEIPHQVLTPGIVNDEVAKNVTTRINTLEEGKPVHIILTGGIHYSKGGDLLVRSMNYIKTPCIITAYGNCELNDLVKGYLAEVPSYHTFEFKGYMEHDDLIKTLDRDADILINTTRSMHVGAQAAGFPFKMMEYASTGRPIVSSEIGKLDEDFNSHITYYDGEDPQSIAAAIENVIANYDSKVVDALELQKRVLKEYSYDGTSRKLDTFFKSTLK